MKDPFEIKIPGRFVNLPGMQNYAKYVAAGRFDTIQKAWFGYLVHVAPNRMATIVEFQRHTGIRHSSTGCLAELTKVDFVRPVKRVRTPGEAGTLEWRWIYTPTDPKAMSYDEAEFSKRKDSFGHVKTYIKKDDKKALEDYAHAMGYGPETDNYLPVLANLITPATHTMRNWLHGLDVEKVKVGSTTKRFHALPEEADAMEFVPVAIYQGDRPLLEAYAKERGYDSIHAWLGAVAMHKADKLAATTS